MPSRIEVMGVIKKILKERVGARTVKRGLYVPGRDNLPESEFPLATILFDEKEELTGDGCDDEYVIAPEGNFHAFIWIYTGDNLGLLSVREALLDQLDAFHDVMALAFRGTFPTYHPQTLTLRPVDWTDLWYAAEIENSRAIGGSLGVRYEYKQAATTF